MLKSQRTSCRLLTAGLLLMLLGYLPGSTNAQRNSELVSPISRPILLRILKAEDERRWDNNISNLLKNPSAAIRKRALLAAGRIGDERSVPALLIQLEKEKHPSLQAVVAFSLGEIESAAAIDALIARVGSEKPAELRARSVEALGKIAAVAPKTEETRSNAAKKAIFGVLESEASKRSGSSKELVLLALTAALRARPEGAGKVIAEFLLNGDARIRADAANALARLRANDGNGRLRKLLISDLDPVVRANAARVLGATEDKEAFTSLLDRATSDRDPRVRVSAIRALAALKDSTAAEHLIIHARSKFKTAHHSVDRGNATNVENSGELLELAAAVGRSLSGTRNHLAILWLNEVSALFGNAAPEVQIARVWVSPEDYLNSLATGAAAANRKSQETILTDWRAASTLAQGLGEIAVLPDTTNDKPELSRRAQVILRAMLDYRNSGLNINTLVAVHSEYAIPDVLRAYAAFKPTDLATLLRNHLKEMDVVVRATAAELLGELTPEEKNADALITALPVALKDQKLNDAALSVIEALAKQKTAAANEAIKTALKSADHLIQRRAVTALQANNVGDLSSKLSTVQTRNRLSDYDRALARAKKKVLATVKTNIGSFTIQLLPHDAPLTVDNFVQLAKRGYFNGISFHRVVPNFVIQGGDPRGDGNGGPGYSIRCEINMVPYERGAVGMALSGKDTGGSQWFVTHSPQPHLDGGYTVLGKVVSGMDVVDAIARGDVIEAISVNETPVGGRGARQGN